MAQEHKDRRRQRREPDAAGTAADEATGQIPTAPNPSADKAKEESGQGPTRGVGEQKQRE